MGLDLQDVSKQYSAAYYRRKFADKTDMIPCAQSAKRYLRANKDLIKHISVPNFLDKFDGRRLTHWGVLILAIEWAEKNTCNTKLRTARLKVDSARQSLARFRQENPHHGTAILGIETIIDNIDYDIIAAQKGELEMPVSSAVKSSPYS